ncbi:Clp protease N-terminal domain-containing protein [Terrabacter sp. NPDC000476]|uniref:Clp protease N-terminal domain-containing protein n=1 Tax=Terrabacter sp. NPDC000476 TaxID=3154258 RepID=UPI003322761D
MFERFTRDARAAVVSTQEVCRDTGADEVRPVHLLLALTQEGSGVRDLLARHGITTDAVADGLGIAPPARPTPLGDDDAAALRSLGIDLDAIRSAVERQFGEGALDEPSPDADQGAGTVAAQRDRDEQTSRGRFGRGGHIRFGRGARKVLELALREAVRSGAREIRTEHIALGLLRVDDEALGLLVRHLGVDRQAVRADLESHGRRTA